jgi:WhiB family redox-sensing transcriptional regulator
VQQASTRQCTGSWQQRARCRAEDPELFFAAGATQEQRAKAVCRACLVRWECLAHALGGRVEHGV